MVMFMQQRLGAQLLHIGEHSPWPHVGALVTLQEQGFVSVALRAAN